MSLMPESPRCVETSDIAFDFTFGTIAVVPVAVFGISAGVAYDAPQDYGMRDFGFVSLLVAAVSAGLSAGFFGSGIYGTTGERRCPATP